MIKLVRLTVRSSHFCRLTTCPSPTTWQMQRSLPHRRPSVRPHARLAVAVLVAVRCPSAGHPRCLHLLSTARSPVPGRFSDSRRDTAAIDCPRSRVDVSGGHLNTSRPKFWFNLACGYNSERLCTGRAILMISLVYSPLCM